MQVVLVALVSIAATFIGIELIKSFVDSIAVSQLFLVRFGKNTASFISDAFVTHKERQVITADTSDWEAFQALFKPNAARYHFE